MSLFNLGRIVGNKTRTAAADVRKKKIDAEAERKKIPADAPKTAKANMDRLFSQVLRGKK